MCVKLYSRDLNPGPYPPHPTSTYTCGVATASTVYGGEGTSFLRRYCCEMMQMNRQKNNYPKYKKT